VERCKKVGGHLATITSREEHEFVINLSKTKDCWVGATDEGSEGQWRWVTGEPFEYTEWMDANQPDNTRGTQHYLRFTAAGWDDDSNSALYRYVCEWE